MNTVQEKPTSAVPPPCSAEHPQHRDPSKDLTQNFNRSRCQFTYSDGRRCGNERASLCAHHASRKRRSSSDEVAPDGPLGGAELEALCSDLTTATNINRALARVFLLTAQGRISQKQAVAFGYLSQLLLQTVPGIRSEFVSAFGYHPWEQRLKTSLESNHDDPGDSGSSRESLLAANVYHPPQKGYPQDALFAGDKVELRGVKEDQELSRVNKVELRGVKQDHELSRVNVDRRPFEERVMEPDYDSIVSRGRDLLAGKYSVTPEGRREAETLNTELELMQPPAAKMPKGARASIIEHMKRWIAQKKVTMRPASSSRPPAKVYPPAGESHGHQELSPVHEVELSPVNSSRESHGDQELSRVNKVNVSEGPLRSPAPPALNYYGHPIPMAVPYDELDRGARFASRTPPRDAQFASRTPSRDADSRAPSPRTSPPADKLSAPPNTETSNIKSSVAPVSPPSSRTSTVSPDPPPTRRPKKLRRSAQVAAPEPSPRPSPPAFPSELDLTPPNRTAHATDWYTPPAWSKNRAADPFPNRAEKRKRELRGMSNSKLRHLQHLNSRAF